VTFISVEAYIRINHLIIDIPSRQINEEGIQLYNPDQVGYWSKGSHKWVINAQGWPGLIPKKMDSLVTLIGDSHIENLMNPVECNLASILNEKEMPYNFFSAGRSGVTLIEALEISNYLNSKYRPLKQFIFVKESDFDESILQIKVRNDATQVDLRKEIIVKGVLKSPKLKKIIYSIKTLYYLRNSLNRSKSNDINENKDYVETIKEDNSDLHNQLLQFISKNYKTQDITFFLHPEINKSFEKLFSDNNLNFYKFTAKDTLKWRSSPNDEAHWSCFGFNQAADQIVTNKFVN
jgi:hypothetical protein